MTQNYPVDAARAGRNIYRGPVTGADRTPGKQFIEMAIAYLGTGFAIARGDLTIVFGSQINLS